MNLDDLHRDLQEHIEMETRDNIERGMPPAEARAAALRKFGNVARVTEETFAVWRWMWLERLAQDLRYALRGWRKSPAFAAVAIVTLALGIGMNTAVFSVVNAVLLRPLPYPAADRLVWPTIYNPRFKRHAVSGPDFFDWKRQVHSFEALANYGIGSMPVSNGEETDQVGIISVGDGFFAMTGARAVDGRLFGPGERNVAVLSHRLAARRFPGGAVGRTVTVNGAPYTIAGVLPESYRPVLPSDFPEVRDVEVYTPSGLVEQNQVRAPNRAMAITDVLGRLRPGATPAQALRELQAIQAEVARQIPQTAIDEPRVYPLQEKLVGGARRGLLVLLVAVGFVLLIACANLANLLLARATARRREIAVRAAIGAGRGRMIAQLLVEGLALSIAGAAAGLALARGLLVLVTQFGAKAVPRLAETTMDLRVLAFTLAVSVVTGLLFGIGPAISLARTNLAHVLKEGGRSASAGATRLNVRRLLMAVELAIALVLLTGAGLMIRSFWRMHARPAGFAPDRVVSLHVTLSGAAFNPRPRQEEYFDRLLDRLRAAPGVEAAGITNNVMWGFVEADGVQFPPNQAPTTTYHCVSSGYFPALGMRLRAGRWLTDREPEPVVMINEAYARAVFGAADPIGRRVIIPGSGPTRNGKGVIVGVVADLKYAKLDADPAPETYLPFRYAPFLRRMDILARVSGDAAPVAEGIRRAVAETDRAVPVYDVETLEHALADSIAPRRFNLLLLGAFAAVALALAVVGIYGVMSYSVQQRSHEIGVRMALGAQRAEVLRMVVRQGMAVALAGIAIGVAGALALTRVMATLLYDVRPTDPATFAAVCGVLAAAALLACCAPALRAARVDPVVALRYE